MVWLIATYVLSYRKKRNGNLASNVNLIEAVYVQLCIRGRVWTPGPRLRDGYHPSSSSLGGVGREGKGFSYLSSTERRAFHVEEG